MLLYSPFLTFDSMSAVILCSVRRSVIFNILRFRFWYLLHIYTIPLLGIFVHFTLVVSASSFTFRARILLQLCSGAHLQNNQLPALITALPGRGVDDTAARSIAGHCSRQRRVRGPPECTFWRRRRERRRRSIRATRCSRIYCLSLSQ